MILVIKNITIEGPETLGAFLESQGFSLRTVDLSSGSSLPDNFDDIEAVVCLGGPMNVYEEEKHPFLKTETAFIKEVIFREIPYMGLCLGSQLLAKAAGARVVRSPEEEVGFSKVVLTDQGLEDVLFKGVNSESDVFQWHGDMWELPADAKLLAQSRACPHQAFVVGPRAYGLQFHVEITDQSIAEWSDAYLPAHDPQSAVKKEAMLARCREIRGPFDVVAQSIYRNFLEGVILPWKRSK